MHFACALAHPQPSTLSVLLRASAYVSQICWGGKLAGIGVKLGLQPELRGVAEVDLDAQVLFTYVRKIVAKGDLSMHTIGSNKFQVNL